MTPELNSDMEAARIALESGDLVRARRLLRRVVHQDSANHRAWLWLAGITDAPAASLQYVKRAQAIAPNDPTVTNALEWAQRRQRDARLEPPEAIRITATPKAPVRPAFTGGKNNESAIPVPVVTQSSAPQAETPPQPTSAAPPPAASVGQSYDEFNEGIDASIMRSWIQRVGFSFIILAAILLLAFVALNFFGNRSAPDPASDNTDSAAAEVVEADSAPAADVASSSNETTAAYPDTTAANSEDVTDASNDVALSNSSIAADAYPADAVSVDESADVVADSTVDDTIAESAAAESDVADTVSQDDAAAADSSAAIAESDETNDVAASDAVESEAVADESAAAEANATVADSAESATNETVSDAAESAVVAADASDSAVAVAEAVETPSPEGTRVAEARSGLLPKRALAAAEPLPEWTPTPAPTPEPTPTTAVADGTLDGLLFNEDRWIDVNLTTQIMTAYDQGVAIKQTYVSTGLWDTPTVTGQYRIYLRLETQNMSGYHLGFDYYIPNVPWVMYFHENYAFHGAYWHNNFGTPQSHGCVNLSVEDSEWLFNFASIGTLVNVHY